MPYNGSAIFPFVSPYLFANSTTLTTRTAIFAIWGGILGRIFMAVRAMGFSFITFSVCFAAKFKAIFINMLTSRQNILNWHVKFYPIVNSLTGNTQLFRPLHSGFSFAFVFNKPITASVALLLGSANPFTITKLIIALVINSIYSVFVWWMPHVIKKVLKAICPSIAYIYATPAIIFKSMVIGVETSLFNAMPNAFNPCSFKPVFKVSFVQHLITPKNGLYKSIIPYNGEGVNLAL